LKAFLKKYQKIVLTKIFLNFFKFMKQDFHTILNQQKQIKNIVMKIAKKYKPEKIILFGSYAWGKPTKDSDVDLLIIKKTKKDKSNRRLELEMMFLERMMPIDFFIYTPEEIKKRLALNDFFVKNIIQKGQLVYEK